MSAIVPKVSGSFLSSIKAAAQKTCFFSNKVYASNGIAAIKGFYKASDRLLSHL